MKIFKPNSNQERLLGLDALRGIAAIMVVLFHYTTNFDLKYGHADALLFYFPWGRYGIEIFFMISGFVILMTLDRAKTVADFAVARFARLYPVYWAAGLITYTVITLWPLPGREITPTAALTNITMIQSVLGFSDIDQVYWTLYVELGFYLMMGAIVAARLRKQLVFILAAVVALQTVDLATGFFSALPGWWRVPAVIPLKYLHLFLIGVLIYQARSTRTGASLFFVALCLANEGLTSGWPQAVATLIIGGLVLAITRYDIPLLTSKLPVLLGTISYSLYLIHANIGYAIIREGYARGINGNISVVVAVFVALFLAYCLTFVIERPSHALLRARYKAWRHPAGAAATVNE